MKAILTWRLCFQSVCWTTGTSRLENPPFPFVQTVAFDNIDFISPRRFHHIRHPNRRLYALAQAVWAHPQTAQAQIRMEIVELGCAAANYPISPPLDENAWELRHCLVVRLLGESSPMSLLAAHVSNDTVLKEWVPTIRKALRVDEVANIFFAVHYQ